MKKERLFQITNTDFKGNLNDVLNILLQDDKKDANDFKLIFNDGLYQMLFCNQIIAQEIKDE